MNTPAPIHVFRPGTHTDVSGKTLAFGEAELEASAKAYDPALHEAPLVVGHPALDAPAYGWVQSLSFSEAGLAALPHQVDPGFAELVRAGRFKKVSASFYTPDSPANPVPGVYYLRHVGFLGAAAPAVKGLKPLSFAAGEEGVVEWEQTMNPEPAFAEGKPAAEAQEDNVEQKDKDALEAERQKLAEERARLDQDKASFAEERARAETAELERIHGEHVAFAEDLVKGGKLLPANKEAVVALLDGLSKGGANLEFTEADGGKKTVASALALKELLQSQPAVVDFAERAAGDPDAAGTVSFAAPAGYTVDAARLALHNRALAYQTAHPGTDYSAALAAVEGTR